MNRKVKIIATLGPASQDESTLKELVKAGMDVARLNFSHGTHEFHATMVTLLRRVSKKIQKPLAILQDLQGPKIRVGLLESPLTLERKKQVILYPTNAGRPPVEVGRVSIPVDFPELFTCAKSGDRILFDDGHLAVSVNKVSKQTIVATVTDGGILSSHKGINLPGNPLSDIPAFTSKDASDLEFGLSLGVDAVAISFVRTAHDLEVVRQAINAHPVKNKPMLVAKLERPEALENLEAILDICDGVMVARGDMGVEMDPEDVPGAQKRIIHEANHKGKFVITATQMLESMIHNPLPTRAEASDVANAVFDGTDAVMLSGETAVGEFPVETVKMMDRIVRQADTEFHSWGNLEELEESDNDDALAIANAARELAHDRDVEAIAVFTRTGRSAQIISKVRPCVPIQAFTPEAATYRRLAFAWGVTPHIVPFADTVEEMIGIVENALHESGSVRPGGQVVLVAGFPLKEVRPPNLALLHTVK